MTTPQICVLPDTLPKKYYSPYENRVVIGVEIALRILSTG
jgi:hypothetical protein